MKKIRIVFTLGLAIVFALLLCAFSPSLEVSAEEKLFTGENFSSEVHAESPDEMVSKYARTPSLDEDFQEERHEVIVKHQYSLGDEEAVLKDLQNTLGAKSVKGWVPLEEIEKNPLWNKENFQQILDVRINADSKASVLNAVKRLMQLDKVLDAVPIYHYETVTAWVPNDTEYINRQQQTYKKIGIEDAWDITRGDIGITVGIMETGIIDGHEDFRDDNNISRVLPGNMSQDEDVSDHKTWVSGVIGAVNNNSLGIAGIAQVSMRPLNGASNEFSNTITFAVQNNISIINASFCYTVLNNTTGIATPAGYNSAHAAALNRYNGLFVGGAGNGTSRRISTNPVIWEWDGEGTDNDVAPYYPASYRLPNVISVGATNNNDNRAGFSNFGATTVDLFAPGTSIRTTSLNNTYVTTQGTSLATPFVTGVAALLLSQNTSLTGAQLKIAIMAGVDIPNVNGSNPLQGRCVSNGRLNAYKALLSAGPKPLGFRVVSRGGFIIYNYNIELTNPNPFAIRVTYNDHMCHRDDGKDFANLNPAHAVTTSVPMYGKTSVAINGNGNASWITAGIHFVAADGKGYRKISYTDGLTGSSCNQPSYNTISDPSGGFNTSDLGSDNIEITGIDHFVQGVIMIPSQIDGKTVTSIGISAFAQQSGITKIVFDRESQVSNIGDSAFYRCSGMKSVVIPGTVINIGASAFRDCDHLEDIIITNGARNIGNNAFSGCSWLSQISIPSSVNSIGDYAFYRCYNLTSVTISSGVTEIGNSAFSGCSGLTDIVIPNSVTSIGSGAFASCDKLASITVPFVGNTLNGTSNTNFGYIFGNYVPASLKTVIITGGSSIAASAFSGCGNITGVSIPASVTSIGANAFSGCGQLKTVYVGRPAPNITVLGSSAFPNLSSIYVPDAGSVTAYKGAANWSAYQSVITVAPNPYSVSLDKQSGSGGSASVTATYGFAMPSAIAPTKGGYTFDGYYTAVNGGGTKYYNADRTSARPYDISGNTTLYANWVVPGYYLTISYWGNNEFFVLTGMGIYQYIDLYDYFFGELSFHDTFNNNLINEYNNYCNLMGYSYPGTFVGFTVDGEPADWWQIFSDNNGNATVWVQPVYV